MPKTVTLTVPGSTDKVTLTVHPFTCARCKGHFLSARTDTRVCSGCRHSK